MHLYLSTYFEFKMLCPPYHTPTFKTNLICLVSNVCILKTRY